MIYPEKIVSRSEENLGSLFFQEKQGVYELYDISILLV